MQSLYQYILALYGRITFIEAPVSFAKMIHVGWPEANMFHSIVLYKSQVYMIQFTNHLHETLN